MHTSHRVRSIACFASLALIGICTLSWIMLYVDSLHERQRAELLITDLKSFPFSTARFNEVRDFANRHDGAPVQQPSNPPFPLPGVPQWDSEGRVQIPSLHGGQTCTPRDCEFEISIRPRLFKLLTYPTPTWVLTGLAQFGFRPWGLSLRFEFEDGRLRGSQTSVVQLSYAKLSTVEDFIPLGYVVRSWADTRATEPGGEYGVHVWHVSGGPMEILEAQLRQTPNAPVRRAFDIDLHCFTMVSRPCNGFAEIAPSAWSDYQSGPK